MAFPTDLTNAVDGSTDVVAAHVNNLEAKVGIDGSAVTTSHDYKLSGVTGTDKAVSKTGTETLTNKTLTSPTINSGALSTPTITSGVIVTSLDMNGTELILDGDGDTTITADTEDQIDIKINNADDFKFTANTFTALSGSSIATDTIAETSTASGVTIDGLNIKDGGIPKLIVGDWSEVTIASGAITVTGSAHSVDTEGDAATDELNTINGGSAGQLLFIKTVTATRDVTLKDGVDNLILAGDFAISSASDMIVLIRGSTNVWYEVSRSDNA